MISNCHMSRMNVCEAGTNAETRKRFDIYKSVGCLSLCISLSLFLYISLFLSLSFSLTLPPTPPHPPSPPFTSGARKTTTRVWLARACATGAGQTALWLRQAGTQRQEKGLTFIRRGLSAKLCACASANGTRNNQYGQLTHSTTVKIECQICTDTRP